MQVQRRHVSPLCRKKENRGLAYKAGHRAQFSAVLRQLIVKDICSRKACRSSGEEAEDTIKRVLLLIKSATYTNRSLTADGFALGALTW